MKFKNIIVNKLSPTGILLIIWIIFFLTINLAWQKIDHRPARWDESAQLMMSEYSFQKLEKMDLIGALNIDKISSTKAGGVPFFSAMTYFVFGDSTKSAIYILISLSLILITVSTYLIGKNIFNPLSGLLGSVLFICYQGTFLWYKYYLPDIPLTAIVTFTVLLSILIYKNKFLKSNQSILLGISIAIGMCIKHLYIIYIALPILYLFILSFLNKPSKKLSFWDLIKKRSHFYISIISGTVMGILYNLLNFGVIKEQLFRNFQHDQSGTSWYVRQNPIDYINTLINFISFDPQTRLIFPIIFLIGLVFSFLKFKKDRLFIYLWIVGSFLSLLYLIYSTMPYYFLPVLPAVALISLSWISYNPKHFKIIFSVIKIIFSVIFLIFILDNFLLKNLGTNNIFKILINTPKTIFNSQRLDNNPFVDKPYWINAYVDGNVATLPYPHYWYVSEMIDEIDKFTLNSNSPTGYYIGSMISEYEWTTAEYMAYKIWQKKLNNKLYLLRAYAPEPKITHSEFFKNYDFLITKTLKVAKNDFYGGWGDPTWAFNTQNYVENLHKNNAQLIKENGFVLIKSYNLPDGSEGFVWGKTKKL